MLKLYTFYNKIFLVLFIVFRVTSLVSFVRKRKKQMSNKEKGVLFNFSLVRERIVRLINATD